MKHSIGVLLLGLALVVTPASRAADDTTVARYLAICETVNRADRNYAAGAMNAAFTDYRAAQKALQTLQTNYPGWNAAPVELRLKHVTERVKRLTANPPPDASTEPLSETAALPRPEAAEPAPWPAGANVTNEFRTVLSELRAAESDNALLLARLKEALSAQPAATDPLELRRAEEKIRALQKENDLLHVELQRPVETAPTATGGTAETQRLRKSLDELNRKLKAQADAAVSLLADKNLKLDDQGRQLADFARERAELEQRMQNMTATNPIVGELRTENAALKQQVQAAQSQTAASATRLEDTQRQLEAAQSRINAAGIETAGLRQTNALLLEKLSSAPTLEFVAQITSENHQLKDQLAAAAPKIAAGARAAELEKQLGETQVELNQLSQRLATAPARDAVAKLTAENQSLRQQLEEASTNKAAAGDTAELTRQVEASRTATASLQKENADLQQRLAAAPAPDALSQLTAENQSLRQQLDESRKGAELLTARAKASDPQAERTRQLEQQLTELQTRFAEADRQLASRSVKKLESKIESLNEQMVALRSRLNVYETKAVPYTREELALFRAPAATSVIAASTLPRKRASSATASLEVSAEKLMADGNLPQAEQQLTQAVQQDDKEVRAFCNLALTQAAQGHYVESEQNARKALALSADDAASLGALGQALASQNRFDEALDVLTRAATLKPKDAGIQTLLGITLAQKGQRAQAETAFRKALQSNPENADAHRNLSVIYLTQQPPLVELARWHYQKSLAGGAAASPEIESKLGSARGGSK